MTPSSSSAVGMDFTKGDIRGMLLKFVSPLLLANLLNSLYNTADMIIIGHFAGSTGTVAVSLGGKLLSFLTVIAMGLSSGGQILIAQQVGAEMRKGIQQTIGSLFALLFYLSLFCGLSCFMFARPILRWMETPAESFGAALAYLRITSLGLPFLFGYTALSSVLRGLGDSRNPLRFIAIAAALNCFLDIVFIVAFRMGAAGTALATVIAQGTSLGFAAVLFYRKRGEIGFDFSRGSLTIERKTASIILRIGLPIAAQGGFIHITQLFIIRQVNLFGLAGAAAYGIGDKIIQLLHVVQQSMQQGGGAMIGQNFGAGKTDRVGMIVRSILIYNVAVSLAFSTLGFLAPEALFRLFTGDADVLAYGKPFMPIISLCLFLSSVMSAFSGVTTGTGNSKLSFLAGFIDGVIFRIVFSFFFGYTMGMGVTGFFFGNTLARLGPIIVHCSYYFSGAWKRRERLVDRLVKTS